MLIQFTEAVTTRDDGTDRVKHAAENAVAAYVDGTDVPFYITVGLPVGVEASRVFAVKHDEVAGTRILGGTGIAVHVIEPFAEVIERLRSGDVTITSAPPDIAELASFRYAPPLPGMLGDRVTIAAEITIPNTAEGADVARKALREAWMGIPEGEHLQPTHQTVKDATGNVVGSIMVGRSNA